MKNYSSQEPIQTCMWKSWTYSKETDLSTSLILDWCGAECLGKEGKGEFQEILSMKAICTKAIEKGTGREDGLENVGTLT